MHEEEIAECLNSDSNFYIGFTKNLKRRFTDKFRTIKRRGETKIPHLKNIHQKRMVFACFVRKQAKPIIPKILKILSNNK